MAVLIYKPITYPFYPCVFTSDIVYDPIMVQKNIIDTLCVFGGGMAGALISGTIAYTICKRSIKLGAYASRFIDPSKEEKQMNEIIDCASDIGFYIGAMSFCILRKIPMVTIGFVSVTYFGIAHFYFR